MSFRRKATRVLEAATDIIRADAAEWNDVSVFCATELGLTVVGAGGAESSASSVELACLFCVRAD